MALSSLDDKFLGEQVDNYCSSSESELDSEDENVPISSLAPASQLSHAPRSGKSTVQTGPKGVIEDWRQYRRLKYEEQQKNDIKRLELIKKLSLTCDPKMDKESSSQDFDEDDREFLQWYNKKRILELQQKFASRWTGITFGKVTELTRDNYVEEIENEKHFVTIIIHIYDFSIPACEAMSGCLQVLAREYRHVKFCQIEANEAQISQNFLEHGLPALLAYKNDTLLGNFVRLSDKLGEDFFANDVESFLRSYGVLPERGTESVEVENNVDPDSRSSDED